MVGAAEPSWQREGNRKSLAEADKRRERRGEALLGEVARAGLQGPSIKGGRGVRLPAFWLRAIRRSPSAALSPLPRVCAVIFGSRGIVAWEGAAPSPGA